MCTLNKIRIVEKLDEGIRSLIYTFLSYPTWYLEEKHIHNEFDKLMKFIFSKDTQYEITSDKIKFPVLINEYATVNKYKREDGFKNVYDSDSKTGSLDYVVLDPEWIKMNNYFTCVNKDENIREKVRNNTENRYLTTLEFKYMHFGKKYISYDDKNKTIANSTIETKLKTIKEEILEDVYKQLNENSPLCHIVFLNSDLPIPRDNIEKLISEIFSDHFVKEKQGNEKLKIWYAQAGIESRFKSRDFFAFGIAWKALMQLGVHRESKI